MPSTPRSEPVPPEPGSAAGDTSDTSDTGGHRKEGTRLQRAGRACWAALGVAGVLALVGYVASVLSIVVVPAVLALFPATLLVPLARWLRRHGAPDALAAITAILAAVVGLAVLVGAMVPLVAAEAPELAESAADGVAEIEAWLDDEPFGASVGGVAELLGAAQEQVGEIGDVAGEALAAATAAFETVIGLVLLLVVLFF